MKTRRSRKAETAAAGADTNAAADATSTNNPPSANDTSVDVDMSNASSHEPGAPVLPIPEDLDLTPLATLLPDANLAAPTPETVVAFYHVLLAQLEDNESVQRALDEARAEVERKEVEVDQAIQDRESLSRELETSIERLQKDLASAKQEKEALVSSNEQLQNKVNALSSTQYTSSTEAANLKHRIEDVEREKRDLVAVVGKLQGESADREEEITTLRGSLKQARQDLYTAESQVRELQSTEVSTKFKLESLAQQLELAQAEAERNASELAAKSEELTKYRRTKHAELAELQISHDALEQTHAALESSYRALQSTHASQTHQLQEQMQRVQDLTGQLAEQEATYTGEISGLKRLVTMLEARGEQAAKIVSDIENQWAGVGEVAERREATLREEIARERQAREEAEIRVDRLETVLQRLETGELPVPSASAGPGTPGRDIVAESISAGIISPTVALASKVQRGGKTFGQVYQDYVQLQQELAIRNAEYDRMERTLTEVLNEIEQRAPILSQQRDEYERQKSEAAQLASELTRAIQERDANETQARELSQKLEKSARENELLTSQLNDLGRQVQLLLKELARQTDPSLPSDEDIELMPKPPANDVDAVITNNLVLFRSIGDLQDQNQRLLRITRELGLKLESEERDYRERMEAEQAEAVREAYETIQDLTAQLERHRASSETTIQAYIKERDTLRAMVDRAGRATGSANTGAGAIGSNGLLSDSEIAKELAEVQAQFDAYKTETDVDSSKLRDDFQAAQREIGRLSAALAKANARVEHLLERQRMHDDQLAMQSREVHNLTARNTETYNLYTRADIERNRLSEDLIAANALVEQLRNDCANLRAEKRIADDIQARLTQENKNLQLERSHLSSLMANVQQIHNDLQKSGDNDRRRLETQIQLLERQSQDLRSQLGHERDSVRQISLQKEIESKDHQAKVERLTEDLSKARENLVGAETSKKHFEDRVEELGRQLQGAEERLAVYDRRGAPATTGVVHQPDPSLPRDEQLEAEVADLRAALKIAEVDLATARTHVQQFKEISDANEAALQSLSNTHDEYRVTMEAEIARHEFEHKALQDKLKSSEDEKAQLAQKLADMQRTFDQERAAWLSDKHTLEGSILDLTNLGRNTDTDRTVHEDEVRKLEERAKAAEERYDREVVSHAEAIRTITKLRDDLSSAQASARSHLAEAETAQAKFAGSEASWQQQKEVLYKEIADLKARCAQLVEGNNELIKNLETVTTQANLIRQAAASAGADIPVDADAMGESDSRLSELRAVIGYLRKEKDIVDLQLEMHKTENSRVKGQVVQLQQDLDKTRSQLAQERERAAQLAPSAAREKDITEKIKQVELLNESNQTLRSQSEAYARRTKELQSLLDQARTELEPVREQVRVLRAEVEAKDAQIGRLETESRTWQERVQQILSKHDRIDPAEVQALKDQVIELQANLQSITDKSAAELAEMTAQRDRNREIGLKHQRAVGPLRQQVAELTKERDQLKQEKEEAGNALQEVNRSLAELQEAARTASTSPESSDQRVQELIVEKARLEAALATEVSARQAAEKQVEVEHADAEFMQKERDALLDEKATWRATAGAGEGTGTAQAAEIATLTKARDEALERLSKLEASQTTPVAGSDESAVELATLRQQLAEANQKISELQGAQDPDKHHQKELEDLRAQHQAELATVVEAKAKAETQIEEATQKIAALEAESTKKNEMSRKRIQGLADTVKQKTASLNTCNERIKELESQIANWRETGVPPPDTPALASSTEAPASSSMPAPSTTPATPAVAVPAAAKPPASPAVATSSQAPASAKPAAPVLRKPSIDAASAASAAAKVPAAASPTSVTPAAGAAATPQTAAVRGARGGARGVPANTRGLAGRGRGRGSAPGSVAAAVAAATGDGAANAAAKRPREDGETPGGEASLPKKPRGGPPVTIRRQGRGGAPPPS